MSGPSPSTLYYGDCLDWMSQWDDQSVGLICRKRLPHLDIATKGIPYDHRSASKLAREQPFNFESWAVTRLPGFAPNTKQRGDGGVDGRATLAKKPDNWKSRLALDQVKGGKFSIGHLREFMDVTQRNRAALGCFVTLDPVRTRSARVEPTSLGKLKVAGNEFRRMNLWSIEEYFDGRFPRMPMMNDPYSGKPMLRKLWD